MNIIESMDTSLTNEDHLFECNLFNFESGNEDSLREHLIDHVNQSQRDPNTNLADREKLQKRLINELDDDTSYIRDDPRFMESESELEPDN